MFRKPNTTQTASFTNGKVVVMCSDGWEDLVDHTCTFATDAEAEAYLLNQGFEAYDPNAELKAMGLVFINGCYRRPGA